jgi:hypothetical protein
MPWPLIRSCLILMPMPPCESSVMKQRLMRVIRLLRCGREGWGMEWWFMPRMPRVRSSLSCAGHVRSVEVGAWDVIRLFLVIGSSARL